MVALGAGKQFRNKNKMILMIFQAILGICLLLVKQP
jgi:hypothetical protein